ncbi:MAG: class I SAM-dependent methyltransferase [Acidobacteriota bacterium]
MRKAVRERLRSVNRAFYDEHSGSFSSTRGRAWAGWTRAVPEAPRSVLDLGCGNGRFERYLEEQDRNAALERYVGTDTSLSLLDCARRQTSRPGVHFVQHDLEHLAGTFRLSFDLTVAFGVLHHVPGEEQRTDFLRSAAATLTPEGRLLVTCWQFQEDPRFASRCAEWRSIGLREDDVEPGDALLRWGDSGDASAVRYCHATAPDELTRLARSSKLELADTFYADGKSGRLNLYAVLRRV